MLETGEVCLLALLVILLYCAHQCWQKRERFVERFSGGTLSKITPRPKFCCRTGDGMACHDTNCNNCSCYNDGSEPIDANRIEALIVRDRKRQLVPTRGTEVT